jgi:hypothetical protein
LAEFLLGALILAALKAADRILGREKRPRGALAGLFLALYFAGRFVIEFWKERQNEADVWILSRGQELSALPFLCGAALFACALAGARAGRAPFAAVPAGPGRAPSGAKAKAGKGGKGAKRAAKGGKAAKGARRPGKGS